MEDIQLLQTIERYLDGQMLPDEKAYFEQVRKTVPEIDQMVVEHNMFLHQIDMFADNRAMRHSLHESHARLLENGDINEGGEMSTKGKVVRFYNKYKKVTAIAACVAGAMALMISGLVAYFAPVNQQAIQELGREVANLKQNQQYQGRKINDVESKIPKEAVLTGGGTGFLIDAKGFVVTNAHVLKGSSFANLIGNDGSEYNAKIVYRDEQKDLAILKIDDEDFHALKNIPYGFRKVSGDLGEEVFTLGYPRNDITYNKGDLSAQTGYKGDTASFQIQMSANPGNSGGPVLNKNGEVIGIVSTREKEAEGVTFAIKSKSLMQLIDELKKTDTSAVKIKIPVTTNIKGMDRVAQVKQIQNCVFLVQAYKNK
jgi:S1-C subfamily serine protease